MPNLEAAAAMYRDVLGAKVSEAQVHVYMCSCVISIKFFNINCEFVTVFFIHLFKAQPEHGVSTVFVLLGDTKIEVIFLIYALFSDGTK